MATFYLGLATLFLGLATFFLENHSFQNGYILVPHQVNLSKNFSKILNDDKKILEHEIKFEKNLKMKISLFFRQVR